MQPYYKKKMVLKKKKIPNSIKFYENTLSLPIYYDLNLKKLNYIKKLVRKYLRFN